MRAIYNRTCNSCSPTKSPSANTLFHKVKFGLDKAFIICFKIATTTHNLSASYLAKRVGVTPYTVRMFMYKACEAMKSSGNFPMKDLVEVDEFVEGEKEDDKVGRSYDSKKKKAIVAMELTDDGIVKRKYINQIKNFSAKELRPISNTHISKTAKITTDLWREYSPSLKNIL